MPKLTVFLLAVLLGFVVLPAAADEPPESEIDCGPDESRELLLADGFELELAAPTGYPDAGVIREESGDRTPAFRNADLFYRVDLAPFETARVTFDLTWELPSDYDLHIERDGFEIGASQDLNVDNLEESVTVTLAHCDDIRVYIRNFAGVAEQPLTLTATVDDLQGELTCVEGDSADRCDGLDAGEAPEPVTEDVRTHWYLSGSPGQASMVYHTAGEGDYPLQPATTTERPNTAVWNSYTRPVVGFHDQYRNPFLPHWPVRFDELTTIRGDVSTVVYVSSPTLAGDEEAEIEPGTLFVDLWAGGGPVGSVEVDGSEVRDVPTPIMVTFEDLDLTVFGSLDLQVGTAPTVSTAGEGEPADALHTVWYDSVQFPSRITLPAPAE